MPQTRTSGGRMDGSVDVGHFAQESVRRLLPVHFVEPPAAVEERSPLRSGRTSPDDDEFPEPTALPQRRSRRGEAEVPADPVPPARPARTQSAEEAGQWMGAFFSTNSGRLEDASHSSTSATDADETSEDR